MGIRIDAVTERQCVDHVTSCASRGVGGWVVTPNVDHMRRIERSEETRELYRRADLSVVDGMPLVWALRLRGTPVPERVAGSDLIFSLTRAAAERDLSVFLLGGDPGIAEAAAEALQAAAEALQAKFPSLEIAGCLCPPFGFESDPGELERIRQTLAEAAPQVVFVALGSPKQERLIEQLRALLPSAWWLGVGISLSFVCGAVKRAPRWMRRSGLEWLHRFAQEPRRLARRYLVDGIPFYLRLFFRCALERVRT
jgi:N-acetylglucosaminyldiphosphoundecaprenol N-acetyl-beta-D-mannosaminyltransferase